MAIYLRLSKEDIDIRSERNDESNSIRTQRLLLYNYISQREDLKTFQIIEYVDDGYSGKNFERPEIKRLLNDVRKNKVQCILVKDFSRFGRDYVEVGNYIEKIFPFMGIRFIAVNNHFDSVTMKAGEVPDMDFSFQNLIYDYYSVENSIKTKSVQEKRRQEGKYMAVYAPYGYLKDPKDKNHLIIDEEAAIQVRNIFEWYVRGKTKADIARVLETKKVLTPAEYMTVKGSNYSWQYKESQGRWCGAMIGRILRNRTYTGTLVSGKTEAVEIGGKKVRYKKKNEWCIIENTHQPIISKELFEEVQKLKKMTLVNKENHERVIDEKVISEKIADDYNLKAYLRCGGCKHKLTRRNRQKASFYCRYYYELHDEKCIKGSVYEDKIIEIVLVVIRMQILLWSNQKYLCDLKNQLKHYRERHREANKFSIEGKIKRLKKENFHRYESYRAGGIDKERYLEEKKYYEEKLEQLEKKYLNYNGNTEYSSNLQKEQIFFGIIEKEIVKALLETVSIYPDNRLVIHMKHKSIWSLTHNKRD